MPTDEVAVPRIKLLGRHNLRIQSSSVVLPRHAWALHELLDDGWHSTGTASVGPRLKAGGVKWVVAFSHCFHRYGAGGERRKGSGQLAASHGSIDTGSVG